MTPAGHPLVPDTASWLRRVGALFIDWIACYGVTLFILRDTRDPAFSPVVSGLFLLESAIGIALTGSSFGQKLLKIEVHTLDFKPLSLLRALERQILILLVIPPLVFRADGRGLHDLLTNSAAYDSRATSA
jgi:hypothetical protein